MPFKLQIRKKQRQASQIILILAHQGQLYVVNSQVFRKKTLASRADWNVAREDEQEACLAVLEFLYPLETIKASKLDPFRTDSGEQFILKYNLSVRPYFAVISDHLPPPITMSEDAECRKFERHPISDELSKVLPDAYVALAA